MHRRHRLNRKEFIKCIRFIAKRWRLFFWTEWTMNIKTTFILLQFIFSLSLGQENPKKEPKNLTESVEQLKLIHHDTLKQKIRSMTESEFTAGAHHGLGMWIRNNWGLWKGKELSDY